MCDRPTLSNVYISHNLFFPHQGTDYQLHTKCIHKIYREANQILLHSLSLFQLLTDLCMYLLIRLMCARPCDTYYLERMLHLDVEMRIEMH